MLVDEQGVDGGVEQAFERQEFLVSFGGVIHDELQKLSGRAR